ncbi:iron ABC transporter substrate-binding protein [Jiella sp. MQZ9-1]|uniref:Iron ABC transporter substrate-binding protein n=1 Tax=Jiella flava TaxID=2816857 RepID=A0A939G104_9HYPH|nr:iron ABC transporter substrate-binding protein [Jiella flava]MBO0664509.1 iron ABC transporter substrate-binding protein [Jiella flava]MCD2473159.1 iron ABC transporter substrate-binding protein [Jiella flava]
MKSMTSRLAGALAFALISTAAYAQSDDGLVVYNAQHESLAADWIDGFTKATGIKVTVRHGGDTEMGNQIIAEGKASPADVFLTENSPAMVLVDKAGLLAPLDKGTLNEVPAKFRSKDGNWVGIAARTTVFAYDKTKLKEADLPKSLLDLANPKWQGRWGASPSGADFQAIVGALLQLKGPKVTENWLKAMKQNFKEYHGNSTVMKAVNAGQIEGGVIYHYYFYRDQAATGENSKNVALHFFKHKDPGAFVSVSGGGVLASSKHKKEAQAFIKWIAGKGGQAVLRDGSSFEYAIGKGAQANPKLVPMKDLDAPKVVPSELDSKKVTELMTEAGLL